MTCSLPSYMDYKYLGYSTEELLGRLGSTSQGIFPKTARKVFINHLFGKLCKSSYTISLLSYIILPLVLLSLALYSKFNLGILPIGIAFYVLILLFGAVSLGLPSFEKITILRGGKKKKIPRCFIIAGDIVPMEKGVSLPYPSRLISGEIHVNESNYLGGGYQHVFKDSESPSYESYILPDTTVVSGSGLAIILEKSSGHGSRQLPYLTLLCLWNIVIIVSIPTLLHSLSFTTLLAISPILPTFFLGSISILFLRNKVSRFHIIPYETLLQYQYSKTLIQVGAEKIILGQEPLSDYISSFLSTLSIGTVLSRDEVLLKHLEHLSSLEKDLKIPTSKDLKTYHLLSYETDDEFFGRHITFATETDQNRVLCIDSPNNLLAEAKYLWDGRDPFQKRAFTERHLRTFKDDTHRLQQEGYLIIALGIREEIQRGSKLLTSTTYIGHIAIPTRPDENQLKNLLRLSQQGVPLALYSPSKKQVLTPLSYVDNIYSAKELFEDHRAKLPHYIATSSHHLLREAFSFPYGLDLSPRSLSMEELQTRHTLFLRYSILFSTIASYAASIALLYIYELFIGSTSPLPFHGFYILVIIAFLVFPLEAKSSPKLGTYIAKTFLYALIGGTGGLLIIIGIMSLLQYFNIESSPIYFISLHSILLGSIIPTLVSLIKYTKTPLLHVITLLSSWICWNIPFYYGNLAVLPLPYIMLLITLFLLYSLVVIIIIGMKARGPKTASHPQR